MFSWNTDASKAVAGTPARNRLGNVIAAVRGRALRGGGRGVRGRGGLGRRGNRNTRPPVTKEQLDAQLAEYTTQVRGVNSLVFLPDSDCSLVAKSLCFLFFRRRDSNAAFVLTEACPNPALCNALALLENLKPSCTCESHCINVFSKICLWSCLKSSCNWNGALIKWCSCRILLPMDG